MESKQIRELRESFDALITSDTSPDVKVVLSAIKLQTEVLNGRLAAIENLLAKILQRSAGAAPVGPAVPRR